MINKNMKKIALILAGGSGAKLWPRSTEDKPKQFVRLADGTMLENTYARLLKYFPPDCIFVATFCSLKHLVSEQLPFLPEENIICEPFGRNTAPSLGLALVDFYHKFSGEDLLFVFPSDHIISNSEDFYSSLDIVSEASSAGENIITIGINPTRPVSRYGYIQVDDFAGKNQKLSKLGLKKVNTFAEKPDKETARRFIDTGDFLWNSGIFVALIDTFLKSFEHHLPEESANFKSLRKYYDTATYAESVEFTFKQLNSISIDNGIIEKADNVWVFEGKFSWSDLGTFDELFRLSDKDSNNNYLGGDVIAVDTHNSLVLSKDKLIGIVGIDNLVVVESEDAILICPRGRSEEVKSLVDSLRLRNNIRNIKK
jgi:mannose-1-phosphate guanylyltransferase